MQIADLPIPHLTSLSESEQLALILAIRERRRYVQKPIKIAKSNIQRSKKDPLSTMNREQLEKLLEELTK